MNSSVSVQEKRLFLEWLLYQFNPGEIEWLLEEIIQDNRKLEMIRFVDHLEGCSKGISITINELSDMHFLFFKDRVKTRDVYTAFHELQMHHDDIYFIQIDFPDKASNLLYRNVTEADHSEQIEMAEVAEELLQKLLSDRQALLLEEKINQTLDKRDQASFYHYARQLKNSRMKS